MKTRCKQTGRDTVELTAGANRRREEGGGGDAWFMPRDNGAQQVLTSDDSARIAGETGVDAVPMVKRLVASHEPQQRIPVG